MIVQVITCPVTKPTPQQIAQATKNKLIRLQWIPDPYNKGKFIYSCELNGEVMPVKDAKAKMLQGIRLVNESGQPCIV